MKVLYGNKEWEFKCNSEFDFNALQKNCPDWKIYLNGNGSGICRMVSIKDVELIPYHHHKIKTPSD